MIRIRRRHGVGPEIPQVAMSDLAFLLLIFFISTTIFEYESGIPLVLPAAGAKAVAVEKRKILAIHADRSGQVSVEGSVVPMGEIAPLVRTRLATEPDLIVSIETDPKASYGIMVRLLDEVRLARASRISLSAGRRSDAG